MKRKGVMMMMMKRWLISVDSFVVHKKGISWLALKSYHHTNSSLFKNPLQKSCKKPNVIKAGTCKAPFFKPLTLHQWFPALLECGNMDVVPPFNLPSLSNGIALMYVTKIIKD